jgi:hypothetical protein
MIVLSFIFKWYDKDIPKKFRNTSDKKSENQINQLLHENSSRESTFRNVKEFIKQIILQRSLLSRVKIEVDSFDDLLKNNQTFYDTDFLILQKRHEELDNMIVMLNNYKTNNLTNLDNYSMGILEENLRILRSVATLETEIITIIKRSDYRKYLEFKNQFSDHSQALINLYQKLTSIVPDQL